MSTPDYQLIARIKQTFATLSRTELADILEKRDRSVWSEEAFVAAHEVLEARMAGHSCEPAQLSVDDHIWQDGECVVLRDDARLPDHCLICNHALAPAVVIGEGRTTREAAVCEKHIEYASRARAVKSAGLVIGFCSLVFLYYDLGGDYTVKTLLLLGASLLASLLRFVWCRLALPADAARWVPIQIQAVKIGCLMLMVLSVLIGGVLAVLNAGWKQEKYGLVLLAVVPPVSGLVIHLFFRFRLTIEQSHPGFLILRGVGTPFRTSLPVWPGYPRTAPIQSPGDIR